METDLNFEGQAAIELEMLADPAEDGAYDWPLPDGAGVEPSEPQQGRLPRRQPYAADSEPWAIDPAPVVRAVVADLLAGVDIATIAARFHNALAQMVADVCLRLRAAIGLNEVALSGGVWQNVMLLERTLARLEAAGFTVYTHHRVPPNDGGLALGQAAVANARLMADS